MISDYLVANSSHFETDDGFAEIFLTHSILVIPNFNPKSHLAYDTLGHELMHMIDKSAKAIGVVYSNDEANDNEWHAYMTGFVNGRIMKEVLKMI